MWSGCGRSYELTAKRSKGKRAFEYGGFKFLGLTLYSSYLVYESSYQ
jgi:hypothetical protein